MLWSFVLQGCLNSKTSSLCIGKSLNMLHSCCFMTDSGLCEYHVSLYGSEYFLPSFSYRFRYWVIARFERTLVMCVISHYFCSGQRRYKIMSHILSVLWATNFVLKTSSCASQGNLSVCFFSSPLYKHSHHLVFLYPSVSLTNWPRSTFLLKHSTWIFPFFSYNNIHLFLQTLTPPELFLKIFQGFEQYIYQYYAFPPPMFSLFHLWDAQALYITFARQLSMHT